MKKVLIIANWKMNPASAVEARRLFRAASNAASRAKKAEVVVCPPFVYLSILGASAFARGFGGLAFGSQNCFWEKKGAYTGEVSPKMLKDAGCRYVIVGHSERRRYFGETDEQINKKMKAALKARLKTIFCVGETAEEKNRGEMAKVLRRQIEGGLRGVQRREMNSIVVAYEPVWAIGTGEACSPEDAESAGLFIRKLIAKKYGRRAADNTPVLYGGSVNAQNAASYIRETGLQGLLVGGASLDAREFARIIVRA